MEEQLYERYYDGWSSKLVRPCSPEDYRRLFDRAFGSDKTSSDWTIKCLRYGLPFNLGSKAETFCVEDREHDIVVRVLELFREYRVPVIFETKSHYIGQSEYVDIIKNLHCAVIVAIMGGTDTLNYVLEPQAAAPSVRWDLVRELNRLGIWTGVRWEPILVGINSKDEYLEDYAEKAKTYGARHVSLFNYRTSNWKTAKEEFENRGFNYVRMLEGNLDENWRPIGQRFFGYLRQRGVPASSPDFVNFPFDSDCVSCCGTDKLFKPYQFTFQYACHLIKEKGSVSWEDMEAVEFREPESYERMKAAWNGGGQYYSLKDSPYIAVLDRDRNGRNVYGRAASETEVKKGLFF